MAVFVLLFYLIFTANHTVIYILDSIKYYIINFIGNVSLSLNLGRFLPHRHVKNQSIGTNENLLDCGSVK